MFRTGKILVFSTLVAIAGVAVLLVSIAALLWNQSVTSEEAYSGGLAASLGQSTERIIVDTRDMLQSFDQLTFPRCSTEHLKALEEAAISRPYVRAIGYWQANKRLCGVGFLAQGVLKPAHADRIYDNGVIAWWPSAQTQVGDVQLFLMRDGDHDVAIDPRMLLDGSPMKNRQAALWVENLRLSAIPWDATLPAPDTLPIGITVDHEHGQVISRYSRNAILPIDIVAREPLDNFLTRHAQMLAIGTSLGLLLLVAWIHLMVRISRSRLGMTAELREGIASGQISVQYQPVVDLASRCCVGMEALARWKRTGGDWVSPSIFIPLAEDAGIVQDVTRAVMQIAVRDMQEILAEFPGMSVNLNLGSGDLKSDAIGRELAATLSRAQLPAGSIKLEITERALLNTELSRSLIRNLRSMGHQVAVDDFGTGYSSLSYLQSFELDLLKIDKSFVEAIGTRAATSHVVTHVIEMARSLNLATVAEGVETTAQRDWLIEHGVLFGQGFLFSKPLWIGDLLDYLRKNASSDSRSPKPSSTFDRDTTNHAT
ncbi:MAG: EAL domain-containing protein [Dokdonella sp.]|uniref:EAL domain-containing protein n=1 Tax=Dokdonella sp. TaxID=2291710 RepID=UPI0032656EEA